MPRRPIAVLVAALLALPALVLAQESFVDAQKRQQALERYRAGEALMRGERFAEAEPEFKAAIALDPLMINAHYSLGQTYMALKRWVEAQGAYRGAIDAHQRIGSLRQRDRATADLRAREEVRELKDTIRAVQSGQAKTQQPENVILKLESRVQELEDSMNRGASEAISAPAEFLLALGSAYFRGGKMDDAAREWQAATRARRDFGEAHNNLAVLYMLQGKYAEAEEEVKAAKKARFPVHPQFEKDLAARKAAAKT